MIQTPVKKKKYVPKQNNAFLSSVYLESARTAGTN